MITQMMLRIDDDVKNRLDKLARLEVGRFVTFLQDIPA